MTGWPILCGGNMFVFHPWTCMFGPGLLSPNTLYDHRNTHTVRALSKVYLFGTIFYLSRSFWIHPIITAETKCRWIKKKKNKKKTRTISDCLMIVTSNRYRIENVDIVDWIYYLCERLICSVVNRLFLSFMLLPTVCVCVCFCLYS